MLSFAQKGVQFIIVNITYLIYTISLYRHEVFFGRLRNWEPEVGERCHRIFFYLFI